MTPRPNSRCGAWLLGAAGGLGTTVIAGARILARGLASNAGLTTAHAPFTELPLPPLESLVFGGHEIRPADLFDSAMTISRQNRSLDMEALLEIKDELLEISSDIRQGTAYNCGTTIRNLGTKASRAYDKSALEMVKDIQADVSAFKKRHDLDRVVMVNLASTEPRLPTHPDHGSPAGLKRLLKNDARKHLRASTLYAYAAVESGCPFVNFAPSNGAVLPGIVKLAERRGVPIMGSDGKTGETLVKTALAPMFTMRNLPVLSWQGYNILGDGDGLVLNDAENKQSKVESKDGVLPAILGYPLHTKVGIDYVPSLGDMKTAWDFIHFQGFLDFRMSLQFIWQGCDSILAAPLVLDLIRLMAFAHERGDAGLQPQLGAFFKSPQGVARHELKWQFDELVRYAKERAPEQPNA